MQQTVSPVGYKREAQAWEHEQPNKTSADLDMTFTLHSGYEKPAHEHTWATKDHIIRTKHAGRRIRLTYMVVEAHSSEVIE